jgi:hypothetical protein
MLISVPRAGDGLTVASRRRYFQAAVNRHMPFSTEYVWTFHLWQEYIDYASYMLSLGYSSYDLTQHLDGQPLQVTAAAAPAASTIILTDLAFNGWLRVGLLGSVWLDGIRSPPAVQLLLLLLPLLPQSTCALMLRSPQLLLLLSLLLHHQRT